METPAVGLHVVADLGVFGKADVAIDDGALDAGVAPHVHVIVDDRVGHFAVAVHAHVIAHYAVLHTPAGENRAAGDDRVDAHAHAVRIGKDEFCGRILVLPAAQGPLLII